MKLILKYPLVLGSISPRRKELLQKMDLEFTVDSVDIDESLPADIDPVQAAVFLAREKAKALRNKYAKGVAVIRVCQGDKGCFLLLSLVLMILKSYFQGYFNSS